MGVNPFFTHMLPLSMELIFLSEGNLSYKASFYLAKTI